MKKNQKNLIILVLVTVVALGLVSGVFQLSVLSVSEVKIEPTGNGYVDPATDEWTGDFWFILMSTDFDDQVCAFMLANDDGTPQGTYSQTGNYDGVSQKTYASEITSSGNQLVPTSNVMVHITPHRPYYEREMEIQQGYYTKKTYNTISDVFGSNMRKGSTYIEDVPYTHYSFADVGGGNWILHTPFLATLYKNGEEIASTEIDTLGGTRVYRLPESEGGQDYINIMDLGKLDTSGYGEPQWTDIYYFDSNNILLRDSFVDNLLEYDNGISGIGNKLYTLPNYVYSFSTHWFGYYRWVDDRSPAAFKGTPLGEEGQLLRDGDFPGWDVISRDPYNVKPIKPDVFSNIIPYLEDNNVRHAPMPTGFDELEKVYYDGNGDGQSENYLRVYFKYGTKSSLINVKISTALADTIVWNPQVAKFTITDFPDFGDVYDIKPHSMTIQCIEGEGSGRVEFTKSVGASISIIPGFYIPRLEAGDSYIAEFNVQNLGTETTVPFSVTATLYNVIGTVTNTATAYGNLMEKTGAATVVHVITLDGDNPVSNLPVTIYYAGTSQTKTTGLNGPGIVTFDLGTSADVSVRAEFAGNALYKSASKIVSVNGGSEATITLELVKDFVPDPPTEDDDWTTVALMLGLAGMATIFGMYMLRRKR